MLFLLTAGQLRFALGLKPHAECHFWRTARIESGGQIYEDVLKQQSMDEATWNRGMFNQVVVLSVVSVYISLFLKGREKENEER